MKYLCLGYYDPEAFEALSEEEKAGLMDACSPHDETLRATGRMVSVASLAAPSDSVSLRPSKSGVVRTDGPYMETKEAIGSYFLIEADSLEQAVETASLHPAAQWGEHLGFGVEVRPIEVCQALEASNRAVA